MCSCVSVTFMIVLKNTLIWSTKISTIPFYMYVGPFQTFVFTFFVSIGVGNK